MSGFKVWPCEYPRCSEIVHEREAHYCDAHIVEKTCPFCDGECDPEGWLRNDGTRGPECSECGATAPDIGRWNSSTVHARLESAELMIEKLSDPIFHIVQWCSAYPDKIFPEPDLKRAAKILKQHGMTVDSISASAMRHVLKGITGYANQLTEILEKG